METIHIVKKDLDSKTKLLKEVKFVSNVLIGRTNMFFPQVLAESDRSRKALEFQLKMKTLEIEAALDTAEETRKKIVELTSEKQKVNTLYLVIFTLFQRSWMIK